MKQAFFITGTGTEVGKTVCTAGLAAAAINMGLSTAVMKPVQTGVPEHPADLDTIDQLVPELYPLPRELANPYAFSLPASPHLAAEQENAEIDIHYIKETFLRISQIPELDLLLIEGVGGLLVPLRRDYLMIDLIPILNIPVILVSLAGLGTLNHTLLSVEALKHHGVRLAGIIINKMPKNHDPIAADNVKTIAEMTETPILAVIPEASPTTAVREFRGQATGIKKLVLPHL